MPRSTRAPALSAALLAALITPHLPGLAAADPGLDQRRDAMLGEMVDRIDRWKTHPAANAEDPAPDAAPAAPDPVADAPPPPAGPPVDERSADAAPAKQPSAPSPAPSARPAIDRPPSPLEAPIPLGRPDARRIAEAALAATNAARAEHGQPPLVAHPILDAAATEYAEHLSRTGQFDHIDPSRPALSTPGDRVRAAGGHDALAAENLITETWLQVQSGEKMFVLDAARHLYTKTPDGEPIPPHTSRTLAASMVGRWLESPGHRRNILDPQAREMGFGVAWDPRSELPTLIAVQLFQRYHRLGEGPPPPK